MSVEENKSQALRLYGEILNHRNLEALPPLYQPDYIEHAHFPGQPAGIEGIKFRTAALLRAFPDIAWEVFEVIGEGDRVVVRWRFSGTHQGTFRGVEATNRRVHMDGIDIYRMADERIAEHWHNVDVLGLLQQLEERTPG